MCYSYLQIALEITIDQAEKEIPCMLLSPVHLVFDNLRNLNLNR